MKSIFIVQNFDKPNFFGTEQRSKEELQKEKDEIIRVAKKVYKDDVEVLPTHRLLEDDDLNEIVSLGYDFQDAIVSIRSKGGVVIFADAYYEDKYCNTLQYLCRLYAIPTEMFFDLRKRLGLQ